MDTKKSVLVVGGAGYIGSHTCQFLKEQGYEPVVFDNLSAGHEWAIQFGPFVKGDLLSSDDLDRCFRNQTFEAVIHFAAHAYVGESVTDPLKYYRNNVAGTVSLLEAMKRWNHRRIVFSSTCATYGVPSQVPITESMPQNPINPYGHTKLMVERILKDSQVGWGLEWVALRYFNAAGADPLCRIGESHNPETHLIPNLLKAIRGTGPKLKVFGQDYPTPDGTCIRDYIHVTDLADAHVRAIHYLNEGGTSDCFNLGNGKGHSIKELMRAAEKITGKTVPFEWAERRPGDPPALVGSAEKAKRVLGWTPKYDDIEVILKTAWEWELKQK